MTQSTSTKKLSDRKPKIVNGVNIHKVFTSEEIIELHEAGRLRGIVLEGYCTRVEDGKIYFVPWYESSFMRAEQGKLMTHVSDDFVPAMQAEVEEEHPIIKRTPQQRVASMVMRLIAEYKNSGNTLPGIHGEDIKAMVGASWKEGAPLTEDDVRAIASYFLGKAERMKD